MDGEDICALSEERSRCRELEGNEGKGTGFVCCCVFVVLVLVLFSKGNELKLKEA